MPLQPIMDRTEISLDQRMHIAGSESRELIADVVRRSGKQWVCVDGYSGAGKSNAAQRLAHDLGWRAVELDGLLLEEQEESASYVGRIDPTKLQAAVAFAQSAGSVVLDGICVRDAMSKWYPDVDALRIYVARVSAPGTDPLLWHDGISMELPNPASSWLEEVCNEYHLRVKPHLDADIVLIRVEQ